MLIPVPMGVEAGPANPSLGAASAVNVYSGAICSGAGCTVKSGTNDSIQVSWSITGANNVYFQTKVYRDGVLKATLSNTTTSWNDTAPGSTGWVGGSTPVSYVYRVDVVSTIDGTVVASQTAPTFTETYFTTCPGPC